MRTTYLVATALVVGMLLPIAAIAADVEEVVVTGSRIKHLPTDGPQPVTIITRGDIEAAGLISTGDLIQRLPIQGSGINRSFNNGGDGSIRVELRSLGAARTLVLVNGRRWVASGEGANSSIDLNTIPLAAIDRVEILKDGASAVYGSDAIAGVVNLVLRDGFNGLELQLQRGDYFDDGGGSEETISVIGGVQTDRAHITLGGSWTKINDLSNADRSQTAIRPANGGSAGTPQGRFAYGGVVGSASNFTLDEGNVGASPADFREWVSPDDRFNFNPDNYIQTPNERRNLFLNGGYDINENVSLIFDALYQNRLSDQLLAPTPLFWGFEDDEGIDVTNVFNPFGVNFCGLSGTDNLGQSCVDADGDDLPGNVSGWFGRRMVEAGNRNFLQDIQTFRAGAGFEGSFEAAGNSWDWDLYASWAQNRATITTEGLLNTDAIRRALGPASGCTGDCVPLNVFGGQGADAVNLGDGRWGGSGSITPEMLNYITFTAHDTGENTSKNVSGNITGAAFELPAGQVGFAAGFEYREETGFTSPDALIVTGATSGNASQPTNGGFDVTEFYAEVNIPLLSDSPFAESLDVNLAARTSDYSTFGSTTTGKYNIMWRPFPDFLVRATKSDGFRAPSVPELFFGQSDSFPELQDPCDAMSANFTGNATTGVQMNAQCIADGVPNGFVQPNNQIRITVGGNPNLQPEESDSLSYGFVYQPSQLEGFQLEVDWFNIEITDTIDSIGDQNILEQCYSDASQFCGLVDRGPGGFVTDLRDLAANVGKLEVEGVDLAVRWDGIETRLGNFDVDLDVTYYSKWNETDALGTRFFNNGLVFGNSRDNNARIRSTAHIDYYRGPWAARWSTQYIHSAKGVANTAPNINSAGTYSAGDSRRNMDSVLYHDLIVSYLFEFNNYRSTFTLGIDNITDEDPPFFPESFANDFDPDYRAWGSRFWYGRVKFEI